MKSTGTRHSAAFKAKVALAAIRTGLLEPRLAISPRRRSPACCAEPESRSAWTDEAAASTTSLSSGRQLQFRQA
jgi:hypothetical protein